MVPRVLGHIRVRDVHSRGFGRRHVPRGDGRAHGRGADGRVRHALRRGLCGQDAAGRGRRVRVVGLGRGVRGGCRVRRRHARRATGGLRLVGLLLGLQHLLVLGATVLEPDFHLK